MATVLLPFPDDRPLAAAVAKRLGVRLGNLAWRHYPDGESLITIDDDIAGADVVLFARLNSPDRKALPLWFAAQTARELGARRVGLVAPYLAYMRQDARFHAGESISANAFAKFLEQAVDWLVTVDPHLHRIAALGDVLRIPATAVAAAPQLANWIRNEVARPILIGPDGESAQWVAEVARVAGVPHEVLRKNRRGDRDVEVSLPDSGRLRGHTPVLVDDIVSTGRTLVAALEHLHPLPLPPAVCVVIHAIFAGDAWQALQRAGAGRIVSTDSIIHPTNAISLAEPIATAVAAHLAAS
jgi:ribose-phosphate pyrophosphokinase